MVGPALIATMVALAAPAAHGHVAITCDLPMQSDRVAQALPWLGEVEMTEWACERVQFVVEHDERAVATVGMPVLLHEAAHVAQWREGLTDFREPSRWFEHDADCRALAALPAALLELGYPAAYVGYAVRTQRQVIRAAGWPYGGECGDVDVPLPPRPLAA